MVLPSIIVRKTIYCLLWCSFLSLICSSQVAEVTYEHGHDYISRSNMGSLTLARLRVDPDCQFEYEKRLLLRSYVLRYEWQSPAIRTRSSPRIPPWRAPGLTPPSCYPWTANYTWNLAVKVSQAPYPNWLSKYTTLCKLLPLSSPDTALQPKPLAFLLLSKAASSTSSTWRPIQGSLCPQVMRKTVKWSSKLEHEINGSP